MLPQFSAAGGGGGGCGLGAFLGRSVARSGRVVESFLGREGEEERDRETRGGDGSKSRW